MNFIFFGRRVLIKAFPVIEKLAKTMQSKFYLKERGTMYRNLAKYFTAKICIKIPKMTKQPNKGFPIKF